MTDRQTDTPPQTDRDTALDRDAPETRVAQKLDYTQHTSVNTSTEGGGRSGETMLGGNRLRCMRELSRESLD